MCVLCCNPQTSIDTDTENDIDTDLKIDIDIDTEIDIETDIDAHQSGTLVSLHYSLAQCKDCHTGICGCFNMDTLNIMNTVVWYLRQACTTVI